MALTTVRCEGKRSDPSRGEKLSSAKSQDVGNIRVARPDRLPRAGRSGPTHSSAHRHGFDVSEARNRVEGRVHGYVLRGVRAMGVIFHSC